MDKTNLGKTGLEVTRLGLGLAEVWRHESVGNVTDAERVLNSTLDRGINFLDTAPCYGSTEEIIGKTIPHRRSEYILATKCGHAVGGATGQPWTPEVLEESIDRSLRRMGTDYIDLLQLHSCDVGVLERGEVIEVLAKAREAGKTRFVGYSGDNEAARWAVDSGLFDTLQTSLNLVDQHARTRLLGPAESKGMGIIIKRPVANNVWGRDTPPWIQIRDYIERAQVMSRMGPVPGEPDDPILLAIGFVFAHPEVDTAIVGTSNHEHLLSDIDIVERRLPIPVESVEELRRRFDEVGEQWRQLV